jgi:hypothetical protein
MRVAQLSREVMYTYRSGSIELNTFTPGTLDVVGSLYDHLLLVGRVGSLELSATPIQHFDMFIH